MTTVNCNVTASKQWTKNAQGEGGPVTIDDLNRAAAPVVTADLSGKIAAVDLTATLAKRILVATVVVGDSVARSNPIAVTIQVRDIAGNVTTENIVVAWWLADQPLGNNLFPTATVPDQGVTGAPAYTYGFHISPPTPSAAKWISANSRCFGHTDGQGRMGFSLQHNAGAMTRYFFCVVQDKLYAGSQALIWT